MSWRPTGATLFVEEITGPTVNDDQNEGYLVGDIWIDEVADKSYICLDVTVGSAVWTEITQAGAVYTHPNHTGEVTSLGDGAQTIANKQTMSATAPITLSNTPTVIAAAAPVIAIPAATNLIAGHATAAHIQAIEANTAKETNVPTALSIGTKTGTTLAITSDGGENDVVLPEADTDYAGLLGADKWDEIVANTAARHTEGEDQALGAVGTKDPPIDADKALYRDSTSSDALVTSTWTQVKAFLKTYFDTLYQAIGSITQIIAGDTSVEVEDTIGTATVKCNDVTIGDFAQSGFRLGGTGARITDFVDEDDMDSDSAVKVPTQQSVKAYVDANSIRPSYVKVSDVKSAGTQGGTFTQDAWTARVLNTEDNDPDNICSLSSNQITLAAGTYECRISAPACQVSAHKAVLTNVTDTVNLIWGTSAYSNNGGAYANTCSFISGRFTIAANKALSILHRCAATRATYGYGAAVSLGGVDEVYTVAEFWKVG